MEGIAVKRIHLRELLPQYGDRVRTITVEEAQELEFEKVITVLPNGEIVRSWDELLDVLHNYREEEVELVQFSPMVGG